MSDPVYRQPGLVVTDDDRLLVLGPSAGPAGSSIAELADGSSWQVDHADPSLPVLLEVDAGNAGRAPLLTTAFGGDETLFLVEDAVPLPTDGNAGDFIENNRPERPRRGPTSRRLGRDSSGEVGEMVLFGDFASDRLTHPLVRTTATLEFLLAVDRSIAGVVFEPLVLPMIDSAESMVRAVDDGELAMLDDRLLGALVGLCHRAQEVTTRVPPVMRDLIDRIDRVVPHAAAGVAETQVSALRMPADGLGEGIDDDELLLAVSDAPVAAAPPPGSPDHPMFRRVGDALVNVTVSRSDTGRWVRVLRRGGMVVLGEAPLRRDGLLDVTEVVVPADVADEDLEVQVADVADMRALAGRPVEAVRSAVAAGREAARADRLDNAAVARIRWERCAQLWIRAGDRRRADQAYELAEVPGWTGRPRASTTDEIAEALAPGL